MSLWNAIEVCLQEINQHSGSGKRELQSDFEKLGLVRVISFIFIILSVSFCQPYLCMPGARDKSQGDPLGRSCNSGVFLS